MSDAFISANLVIDQIDQEIAVHDSVAEGYAQLLRDNKIDWVSANRQIYEGHMTLRAQVCSLLMVLRLAGLDAEREACKAKAEAAGVRNEALLADLRANCLLNGPKRVPA